MARQPLGGIGRVKGGPARGGLGRELRFYQDQALTIAKTAFVGSAGGAAQPVPIVPNAGKPRALAADRAAGDAFVTVAVGQTGLYNVGDLIPIWNAVQGTVYRVITVITPATGRLDLDSALGIAFTVANGTMVNAQDMEGYVWAWFDDATDTWMQVKELGSGRLLAPVKVLAAVPAGALNFYEEGVLLNNRPAVNFVGRSVTATDDIGNNRVNVTIGIAGSEAAPAPEVLADTPTGLWGEGGSVLTIVGGGKRALRVIGGPTLVNYAQVQANVTSGPAVFGSAGADAAVGVDLYTKGSGANVRLVAGGARLMFTAGDVASAVNYWSTNPNVTGNPPWLSTGGSDSNVDGLISSKGTGVLTLRTGSTTHIVLNLADTASAVNYTQISPSATGNAIAIASAGTDAAVPVSISTKGTASYVVLYGGSSRVLALFQDVASAVNYWTVSPSTTGNRITATATGTDATVGINLAPKGTGADARVFWNDVELYRGHVARKTADESVNNSTTLQNDDHLSHSLAANSVYYVVLVLNVDNTAANTAGFKWDWTIPTGMTGILSGHGFAASDVDASGLINHVGQQTFTTARGGNTAGFNITTAGGMIVLEGFVVTTNAGTLQLRWAQSTAVVGNTTVKAGSLLLAQRLNV